MTQEVAESTEQKVSPDFDRYKAIEVVSSTVPLLRPSQLSILSSTAVCIFALSTYSKLGTNEAIVLVIVLAVLSFIHSIMVDKRHAKATDQTKDDSS